MRKLDDISKIVEMRLYNFKSDYEPILTGKFSSGVIEALNNHAKITIRKFY